MEEVGESPLECFSNVPHVVDLIFQHFSVADLLNVTEISPVYHDFIFNSKRSNNFKLLIDKENFESSANIIDRFQNLQMNLDGINIEKLCPIIPKSENIKFLTLHNVRFASTLLRCLEERFQNLEELKLCNLIDQLWDDSGIKFENVKKLTIHDAGFMTNDVIKTCPHITSLDLAEIKPWENFFSRFSRTLLKLKEFRISVHSSYNNDLEKEGLQQFLSKHQKTLESLTMDVWVGIPSILEIIYKMPNLKKLELYELSKAKIFEWTQIRLPINKSLTNLTCEGINGIPNLAELLVQSAPNLRKLKFLLCTLTRFDALDRVEQVEFENTTTLDSV